jgi:hypothetical protein
MSEERDRNRERESREEGVEEVGRRGGMAASMAGGMAMEREAVVALGMRDLVRWGPIWAGLLIALSIQIVLGTVGLAVALRAYNPAAADYSTRVASTLSIWSVVSALIALFVGGYVAGRMAAVLGLRNGLVQGTVVWALGLLIGVILSAMGIAGLLSSVSISPFLASGGAGLTSAQQMNLARNASSGAWWFVVGSVIAWIAAAGGGVLGAAAHTEAVEEGR